MAIKSDITWHHRFRINWTNLNYPGPYVDADDGWRMKMLEGGALLFETMQSVGPPHPGPPDSLIVGPHRWTSMRIRSVSRWLSTKTIIACEDALIWLKGESTFGSVLYDMRLLADGTLILREEPSGRPEETDPQYLEYLVVAPHAWERVRTSSVDFLPIKGSRWCDKPWVSFVDNHPSPGLSKMRIIDGSMLLFQVERGDKEFVIVAPHAWSGIKQGSFDFLK